MRSRAAKPVWALLGRTCAALLFTSVARAQQPPTAAAPDGAAPANALPQLYAQAMAEFQAGDFAKCATDLEALLTRAEASPQFEPLYYTLGSAYFNAGNYPKAIAAFKNYHAKFPSGPHARDVLFGMAQSSLATKNYADAAKQFAIIEKDPRLRDAALLLQATALKQGGKMDEAIATLEKLASSETKTSATARGLMMLAQLYGQKGTSEKAVQTLAKLNQYVALVDNVVELNSTTVELGDELYKKGSFNDALECYRMAAPRERIVRMQNERIASMQRAIEQNIAAVRRDPAQISQLGATNNQLKADVAQAQQLLAEFLKLPDITPAIYVRMARSFCETDRKWEAIVVYQELLDRFPAAPEREPSLFGIISALAEVNQPRRAIARCEEYMRDFKDGPNAETVAYFSGAVALQANDAAAAEAYFTKTLEAQPKSPYREQMRYLLGNAKFIGGKYDEAIAEYKRYLADYPKGQDVEDSVYRLALTALFAGKYEDAMKQFNAFVQKYPQSSLVPDARYRLAVCKYAASLYDQVIADCEVWEHDYGTNPQLGEVLSLAADAYAATDREQEAIPIYIRAYKSATTDEVMNYALFAASKLLQKRGQWHEVADLFNGFIAEKSDDPGVITALYWIGKAKAHEGQLEEAKRITADTIKKYIGDPQRESVELLLTELAQLCVKKKRAEANAPAAETNVPPPSDPGAELDALLGARAIDDAPAAKARILFAKAELARLRRQPAEEEKKIGEIAEKFKPEELSPMLLGRAGDYLLAHDNPDAAQAFYQRLFDELPKSENVDFAYNGLGEIALRQKDYAKALRFFSDGAAKAAAGQKLKEITIGKAKTLLAMDRLQEAKKVFEQIASVREWRGESTAFSVYSLGEIEARAGHWAEANAYFQRVFVGYQKFLPWVAKAYLGSAETFEQMGKTQEAANTYRELLRNQKLAEFAEAEEARKKLAAMGQQG